MHRAFIDDLTFESFLEKQGKLKTWSWTKYWFVLDDDQLAYYKDTQKTSSQGLIDLAQAHTVRTTQVSRKGYALEIVTQSRAHLLCAETIGLQEKWLKLLRQAMMLRKRKSSLMFRPSCDSISDDEEPCDPNMDGSTTRSSPKSSAYCNIRKHSGSNSEQFAESTEITRENSYMRESSYGQSSSVKSDGTSSDIYILEAADSQLSKCHNNNSVKSTVVMRHSGAECRRRSANSQCKRSQSLDETKNTDSEDDDVFKGNASAETKNPVSPRGGHFETGFDAEAVKKMYQEMGFQFTFPPVSDLPHPRLELTWGSSFDQIRTFIANNRRPNELYATPRQSERGGKAINKLRGFLSTLS